MPEWVTLNNILIHSILYFLDCHWYRQSIFLSLTCLMACWTLSRFMSLASLSSVASSIFSIDTLYWHSSTTTTSGCTARIVWESGKCKIKKQRHSGQEREINGKWAVREEVKTENQWGKNKTYAWQEKNANLITVLTVGPTHLPGATVQHLLRVTPLFHWQLIVSHFKRV